MAVKAESAQKKAMFHGHPLNPARFSRVAHVFGLCCIPTSASQIPAEATVKLITKCYESDEISKTMPGKNDFVTGINNGNKQHVQKKLVMFNLMALYQNFKDKYPYI